MTEPDALPVEGGPPACAECGAPAHSQRPGAYQCCDNCAPYENLYAPPSSCRACGGPLLSENKRIADGCACNSPRGVNHGLVAKNTCTCAECDPAQTGGTRIAPSLPVEGASIAEALEALEYIDVRVEDYLPLTSERLFKPRLKAIRLALERAAAEGEALRAEVRRTKSEFAERAAMCLSNMGHDVTCGACMSQAFTGCGDFVHTCPAPPKGSTP